MGEASRGGTRRSSGCARVREAGSARNHIRPAGNHEATPGEEDGRRFAGSGGRPRGRGGQSVRHISTASSSVGAGIRQPSSGWTTRSAVWPLRPGLSGEEGCSPAKHDPDVLARAPVHAATRAAGLGHDGLGGSLDRHLRLPSASPGGEAFDVGSLGSGGDGPIGVDPRTVPTPPLSEVRVRPDGSPTPGPPDDPRGRATRGRTPAWVPGSARARWSRRRADS
jgi:hypothetical protein